MMSFFACLSLELGKEKVELRFRWGALEKKQNGLREDNACWSGCCLRREDSEKQGVKKMMLIDAWKLTFFSDQTVWHLPTHQIFATVV